MNPKLLLPIVLATCIKSYSQLSSDSSLIGVAQQQNFLNKVGQLPDKIFDRIAKNASAIEKKIERQNQKYLSRIERQERKLKKTLSRKDSVLARQLFDNEKTGYDKLKKFTGTFNRSGAGYSGHLDSISTALNFLKANSLPIFNGNGRLREAISRCKELQEKFRHADHIKKYLTDRKRMLKDQFQRLGMVKQYRKFEKQIYYYKAQVNEYKQIFDEPSKLEAKLIEVVSNIPAFKNFYARNSILATLFPNIGQAAANQPGTSLTGLQPRATVSQFIAGGFGSTTNYNQVLQRNIQSAQGEIDDVRNKLKSLGKGAFGNSDDFDIPDFKPNDQKTKSFFQRLEYGTNFQTAHSTYYFPTTTDLGLSLGYKLNEKNIIGIGASYKVGWGKDIRHIDISSQGIAFRSFADLNIRKSFFLSGGFEYNYQKPFGSLQQISALSDWQQSGLIGMSKIVSLNTKIFKKTKIQLLWDFLSYRQLPNTQAFKFRIGYNF